MPMTRSILWCSLFACVGLLFPAGPAAAWSNHSLGTYPALEAIPEVKDAKPVQVETIEQFLEAEQKGLAALLKEEEAWARQNIPNYPARPDALEFKEGGPGGTLRDRFLKAIRVNPTIKLALFVQPLPGADAAGRSPIAWQEVTILQKSVTVALTPYLGLKAGEQVRPIEVVATAADEPDYGIDIGLWEDNGTDFGKAFGFGPQPYGNPKLEYSSQAPFHMGFYHEAGIVYTFAGFLKRTFPEVRLHQLQSLARYAFKTGHPYWGWRFVGWGLHYIQDLTQPYHARVLPGVSVPRMLTINTLAMMGAKKGRDNAVQLVTNRHLALENYQYHSVQNALAAKQADHPVWKAHSDTSKDSSYGPYQPSYPREVLTKESEDRSKKVDRALEDHLPEKLVDDPEYLFETTEPDINVVKVLEGKTEALEAMNGLTAELLTSFGAHSRNYVRAALAP